jgi:Co/Zn/Cd efflux system component
MQRAFHHRWRKVIFTSQIGPSRATELRSRAPSFCIGESCEGRREARVSARRHHGQVHHTAAHRHGIWTHEHHQHGPHRHPRLPFRSVETHHDRDVHHRSEHGHTHGLVDPSIVRSRDGVQVVAASLAVLGITAVLQMAVFALSGSVALLSDLIHNAGDALTAIPLGIAFVAANRRWERWSGYAVVATIFASACVAAYEAVDRLVHPEQLDYLVALAAAGVIGFVGNEVAARIRLRGGRRLDSRALTADGHHARVDGCVSLGVIVSAVAVAAGVEMADPLVSLAITALILRITWQAWQTIRSAED